MDSIQSDQARQLTKEMAEAMVERRYSDVASLWERLGELVPSMKDNPTVPVLVALREGRAHDGLHLLNSHADDQWPQLRAMCLHAMDDPLWEGYAQAAEASDDPFVRDAMRQLMRKPAMQET